MTTAIKLSPILFILLLSACANEEIKDYTILYEADVELYDIIVDKDGWTASGGETFELGVIFQSNDEESSEPTGVVRDSLFDKSILCLDTLDGVLAAAGIYSIISDEGPIWNSHHIPDLYFLNDIILESDRILTVGGAGLSTGIFYEWNRDLSLRSQMTFDQELSCIYSSASGENYVIGGYGFLKVSQDLQTWHSILDRDDHYLDFVFPFDSNMYVLGASGRVLKYRNIDGDSEQIRPANLSGISEAKDLHMANGVLYLAEGNSIYKTSLDEINWVRHEFEDLGSINKISSFENSITFVTSDGEVVSFVD